MKKILLFVFLFLLAFTAFGQQEDIIQVSVTVEGTIFSLELQDSTGAPWSGFMDFGTVKPGKSSFPDSAIVVASCKSNLARQWFLQVSATKLREVQSGYIIPEDLFTVYVGDPAEQGQPKLPGTRHATGDLPFSLSSKPIVIYSSDNYGDIGFAGGWGTYVPVGFGLTVPDTQKQGNYGASIVFTMTE